MVKPVLMPKPKHPCECPYRVFSDEIAFDNHLKIEDTTLEQLHGEVLCSLTFQDITAFKFPNLLFGIKKHSCQLTENSPCTRTIDFTYTMLNQLGSYINDNEDIS